jgi:hypothetical protein
MTPFKKKYFFKFTILILAPFFCSQTNGIIYWSKQRKLTFSDFTSKSGDTGAASYVQFNINHYLAEGKVYYSVKAYFVKDSSWMLKRNSDLLNHEQKHFDNAEIGARKIRKYLCTMNGYESEKIETDVSALINENNRMDSLYDVETSHGTVLAKQHLWDLQIQKILDSLDKYENTDGCVEYK